MKTLDWVPCHAIRNPHGVPKASSRQQKMLPFPPRALIHQFCYGRSRVASCSLLPRQYRCWAVSKADSGQRTAAKARAQLADTRFGAVLIDVEMPDIDDWALATEIELRRRTAAVHQYPLLAGSVSTKSGQSADFRRAGSAGHGQLPEQAG